MGRNKFLEALGVLPRTDDLKDARIEVVERETAPDSSEVSDDGSKGKAAPGSAKVAHKPDSAPEPSDSDQEINTLKARLVELEEKQQRDGEGVKEQLNTIVAELKGEIKASPAIVQSEQILGTVEKLQHAYNELQAENEAARCPECGALCGWNSQVKEIPQMDFEELPAWSFSRMFPFDSIFGEPPMVKVRQCPACGYTKKVEEETEEAKQPVSEEKVEVKGEEEKKELFPFNFKT